MNLWAARSALTTRHHPASPGSGIGIGTELTSVNSEDDCCAISGDGEGL